MPFPKLTADLQTRICLFIRSGNWAYVAAEAVGIHRNTYFRWMRYGRNAQARGERNQYRVFLEAVEKASSEGEVLYLEGIRKAAVGDPEKEIPPDPKAAQWILTHRFPGRWGLQQSRMEHGGTDGGPVRIELKLNVPRPPEEADDSPDN